MSALAAGALLLVAPGKVAATDLEPWKDRDNAIIVDAYELNEIDWPLMLTDERIAGFISKASDGLPESFDCKGEHDGDTVAHCKTMWRKYAVSRELYETRRLLARAHGLLWGAYHLARPGNPIDQANHFLDYAKPQPDELMVLDIEGLDPKQFMSLEDAQVFAGHIKTRTGRYPVLYTNHSTARHIAANRSKYRILARLPLWYARYKPAIRNVFPLGNWDGYALWQFSAAANCNKRRCPYRIKGALVDIDVNVAAMDRAALAKIWAFGALLPEKPFDGDDEIAVDEIFTASVSRGAADEEPRSMPAKIAAEAIAGVAAAASARVQSRDRGAISAMTASSADGGASPMIEAVTPAAQAPARIR
ncbi:glycoside hydrolase family 25 protein [Mycoplana dimorpha]|uniref:GH25 family lysozyme M1 (1,4-beta-N-acetylmuramidase) n=1 Tax=Mycoplana dimorpha TaxID=28320 RepID=A0A2T5BHM4_MYCDI|nr:GH25 family lysozyme [Mycoplana dimorpha]PTM98448.1 GH25 family lysozyme M1 (1,4-beta-N-acetylmuramidase) [Mycoplana dimorpha]